MGLLKMFLVLLFNPDSVAVSVFEAKGVTDDVAYSLSTAIRDELGKQLPVLSSKELEAKGILAAETFDKVIEICRTQNIPILIGGEVKKVRDKYRIQTICLHFMKIDTIVTITSSPISAVSLLANSLIKLVSGEKETRLGSISFATDPDGAEILLDGEYIGITPEKIDLVPFGEHSVLFSKRGYATAVKLIVIYPGKTTDISSSLVPVTGSLIAPADKAPVYFIEEIVVRGEKIREELFRVPKGIDVLTTRDIECSGAKDIPELLSQVAGVSVRDKTGSGVATSVSIRGMDPSKYTIVTLDGIVINRLDGEVNWGGIPMDIVKRIEVIKGATSAPYGGEAMGGVINIVTKERQKNKISLSSTNARDGGWAATLSATDGWDIWVNTHGRKGKGWREEEDYDIRTFYGKFSFPIYEKGIMIFSLDAIKKKNLFPGGLDERQLEENRAQSGEDKEEKLWENLRLTSQYETKTPDSKFSFKFHTMPQGYKATGIRKWELNGIDIGASSEYKRENFSFSTEIGGSNLRRKIHPTPLDATRSDDNSQSIKLSSMLEWEERLFNVVILTPGVKYEWIAYRLEDYTKIPHPPLRKIGVSSLSPKFGLIWSSMRFDAFSSLERTIRPPKPYEKVKNIELKPEVLTAIELGTRVRRYPFTGSASVFYIAIEDPILMKGITFENYQDAFHRGIESEINWRVSRNFSFFLEHTYLEARFRETNKWVPHVPSSETSIGAKISYMPVYSLIAAYNLYGKSYLDFENRFGSLDPYESLDITLKFKPTPSFSLVFSVTNFTGEEGSSFGYELYEKARYYPIAPKGFRIEAALEF